MRIGGNQFYLYSPPDCPNIGLIRRFIHLEMHSFLDAELKKLGKERVIYIIILIIYHMWLIDIIWKDKRSLSLQRLQSVVASLLYLRDR